MSGPGLELYILGGDDGKTPVRVEDVIEWGRWRSENRDVVANEIIAGAYEVSTVFVGIEMNVLRLFNPAAPSHLFESMVFKLAFGDARVGVLDGERCSTWAEAEAQHARIVAGLRKVANG